MARDSTKVIEGRSLRSVDTRRQLHLQVSLGGWKMKKMVGSESFDSFLLKRSMVFHHTVMPPPRKTVGVLATLSSMILYVEVEG